jgi:23S rRNA (guanine745-N1)-methyltransferase
VPTRALVPQLLCPVRACHLPLAREPRRLVCPRGHSFDVSRTGYLNLLQPQDRRSKHPGDTKEVIAARRRLHEKGVTAPINVISDSSDIVLDAGCGDGFYLATQPAHERHGIDISVPAIEAASRTHRDCQWIVANADRFIPYADRSFSLILSITARMNPPEFRRVLRDNGRLLVAIPAPDDLIELRGKGRDRTARTITTFAGHFTLTSQTRSTTTADLDAEAIQDILVSIYRPLTAHPPQPMSVTLSLDLLQFEPAACTTGFSLSPLR